MLSRLVILCAVTLFCGCGPAKHSPKLSPLQYALKEGRQVVENSRQDAMVESEDLEQFRFQIRHNPGRCDSPVFEAFLKGRWIRAYLNVEDEQVQKRLEAFRQQTDIKLLVWGIGKLTDSTQMSPKRVPWPVIDINKIEGATPPLKKVTLQKRFPCVDELALLGH